MTLTVQFSTGNANVKARDAREHDFAKDFSKNQRLSTFENLFSVQNHNWKVTTT